MIDEHAASLFRNAGEAYEADRMDEAIASFEKLCNDSMPEAFRYLGFIYRTEDSVLDKERSKFWYSRYFFLLRQRVARGDVEAICALGMHYLW